MMLVSRRTFGIMVGEFAVVACSRAKAEVASTEVNQGGDQVARSPDGRSVVRSTSGEDSAPDSDPRSNASLWLHESGSRPRLLTRYYRSGQVIWTPDSRRVVFLAEGVDDMQLHLFDRSAQSARSLAADRRIRAQMRLTAPRLQVQTHVVRILQIHRSSMMVEVSETGPPAGATSGRFIERRRDFEIAFSPLNVR